MDVMGLTRLICFFFIVILDTKEIPGQFGPRLHRPSRVESPRGGAVHPHQPYKLERPHRHEGGVPGMQSRFGLFPVLSESAEWIRLSVCLQLSGVCKVPRITSKMPVRVILVFAFHASVGQAYSSLGCFRNNGSRAIPPMEGQDPFLNDSYHSRENPIHKCYLAALRRGYQVFAVQRGGQCFSGPTAHQTYNKSGPSDACKNDSKGGTWANQVYNIKGWLTTLPL